MTSIFPQEHTIAVRSLTTERRLPSYGKSPLFDFTAQTPEFKTVDGKVVMAEGIEVLKNWIEKTLRTERYRFPIYSFNYGITLEELCSKDLPFELLSSELKNQITEALLQDRRIKQVAGFGFSRNQSTININFEVTTFDKEVIGMEVNI